MDKALLGSWFVGFYNMFNVDWFDYVMNCFEVTDIRAVHA